MKEKILIIDDEKDMLAITVARLEKSGYEVIQASEGKGGLKKMEKENPDIVILDLMMPGMDGYEVSRRKNDDPRLAPIPLLVFTASVEDIQEKVRETGADGYIAKPFNASDMIKKISDTLNKK